MFAHSIFRGWPVDSDIYTVAPTVREQDRGHVEEMEMEWYECIFLPSVIPQRSKLTQKGAG